MTLCATACVLATMPVPTAAPAQTRAGHAIENVAVAAWTQGGTVREARSNIDARRVDERLDLALVAVAATRMADGRVVGRAVLTNTGNGQEAFALDAAPGEGTRAVLLAIDRDGDGLPGPDDPPIEGATPVLAPGETLPLLLVLAADTGTGVRVTLTARARTGSGEPGTAFAQAGDGGVDAVVGATHAASAVALEIADAPAPTLGKTQAVRAPDGTARAVRGATITYTLEARFAAAARAARIDDAVPAGTRLVPGTLRLDGAALADAEAVDAAGIHAALGPVAAGAVRRLSFQVVIQ